MTRSREERQSRALALAEEWGDPQRAEAGATTFLDPFFARFGRDRRSVAAKFEHRVELEKRGEARSDLFRLGHLLAEMKSTGKILASGNGRGAPRPLPTSITLMPT